MMMQETADTEKIQNALSQFHSAKILDEFTNGEATRRLRTLETLNEKHSKELDTIIDEFIHQKNFVEI
jgi:hypothetical protein